MSKRANDTQFLNINAYRIKIKTLIHKENNIRNDLPCGEYLSSLCNKICGLYFASVGTCVFSLNLWRSFLGRSYLKEKQKGKAEKEL